LPLGDDWTRYLVLLRPKLLTAFVDLGKDASRERILAFANEWGPLGQNEYIVHADFCTPPDDPSSTVPSGSLLGASLNAWRFHACKVATLYQLWDWVRRGDAERLAPYIRWQKGKVNKVNIALVSVNGKPDAELSARWYIAPDDPGFTKLTGAGALPPGSFGEACTLASATCDPDEVLHCWERGDPVEPMRYYVIKSVNQALAGHFDREVLPNHNYAVRYFPDSLLAAVYLRLQDRIAGGVSRERECLAPGCPQRWFTPNHRRQKYCSTLCRKRAHYHAQKEKASDGK